MFSLTSTTKYRFGALLAWLLLLVTLIGQVGLLLLEWMGCKILINPASAYPAEAYGLFMLPASALAFAILGTLINTYRPDNRIGWLSSAYGLLMTWALVAEHSGQCGFEGRLAFSNFRYALWLGELFGPFAFLSLALLPMFFPNGRFLSVGWRRVGIGAIVFIAALLVLRALWPIPMLIGVLDQTPFPKPIALSVPSTGWLDATIGRADFVIVGIFFAGIISLVLRWRRVQGDERQQMKWLVYHLATAGLLFIAIETIGVTIYPAIFDGWFYLIALAIFWLGLPVVFGFAIFKYRLYDIDIIVNRALVYGLLTLLLALIYFGSIIVLQRIFTTLTGQQSNLAIVISTLVIAVLFNPLRLRLQGGIDRRFFRQRYDAEQALQDFALTARDEVDADALRAELQRLIERTIQPAHITVWMSDQKDGDR